MAADVLDKVAKEEKLSGHGGASRCSGSGSVLARRRRKKKTEEALGGGMDWDGLQASPEARISTRGQAGRGEEGVHALSSVESSWQEVEDAPALPRWLGWARCQVGRGKWEGVGSPSAFLSFS